MTHDFDLVTLIDGTAEESCTVLTDLGEMEAEQKLPAEPRALIRDCL